jgi:hypothetical protein
MFLFCFACHVVYLPLKREVPHFTSTTDFIWSNRNVRTKNKHMRKGEIVKVTGRKGSPSNSNGFFTINNIS